MPADLYRRLSNLDGKSYGAYKSLRGSHELPDLDATLFIDKVQSDPYAPASRARVHIPLSVLDYRGASRSQPGRFSTAELDLLNRRLVRALKKYGRGLFIDSPGQQVLRRAAVSELSADAHDVDKHDDALQISVEIQLPARGRRILGREAARLICENLLDALDDAIVNAPIDALEAAAELEYDQSFLRRAVADADLIGFVADGAVLPRQAGNSQLPKPGATAFTSPESLQHSFQLPSGNTVHGMGIPRGVTLIVGGGYHGKSTLLSSLVTGVYNHVAGDGREFVVADETAVALRAEDGRAITGVDISPFINGLPSGDDTTRFSTANASGSTSQAAGLMEALGSGARVLLIDEDTSATNFMIRDERMRRLIPDDREPITPLVVRVRELWEDHGISTVIVAGGSGAFIDVADTVIAMDAYTPYDVTERARELRESATPAAPSPAFAQIGERLLQADFPAGESRGGRGRGGHRGGRGGGRDGRGRGGKPPKPPRARGLELIQVGKDNLDLRAVSQLMDSSQTEAIARILGAVVKQLDGRTDLTELIQHEYDNFCHSLFDATAEFNNSGHLAEPRFQEVAAAINRLRLLR
ncbi:ABC-ATPase domain-containing protein [Corynebacterium amycolatum]|uniref:ABC-ATPase domain-containing protein n=1 Tax=Corynebacterium amycolatum TaxID=43765 RepID=A0AAW9SWW5_CORAY|nr:ABC-ATPase domain-containing protein [Corynebacterium amycolatum]MDK7238173.1 ABC-ATPase domain-containing protein [Corynebacterium amycolatum]MDK7248138.1 ABC-ATPase domain-containing protein [Corynebacterium amycolatum]